MFKNMLKRAWLSVVRKPSRTIILTIILFIMANMILATLAIKTSVEKSMDYAKDSLGAVVYLETDMAQIMENMPIPGEQSDSTDRESIRDMRPEIPVSMVQSIADSEYIKDYTYSVSGTANAVSFEPVETEIQQMRDQFNDMSDQMTNGRFPGGGGGDFGGNISFGDTTITGINSFAFISQVESGGMSLHSGEIFDESTDNSVMISLDLADQNDLSIGDEITVSTVNPSDETDTTEITLTIIGTYTIDSDDFNYNTIYMNPATATQFATAMDSDSETEDYAVESVKYYLTSAEVKDTFLAEANEKYPTLTDDNLTLNIDTSAYEQMVGPIESVGSFATTILWIVMIAALAIITLIITINVKDRRYEMGVLLSIGATKLNILGAFILELFIVGTVAFTVSIATGTFVGKALGSNLLDSQVAMSEQQTEQNFGRGQNAPGGMPGNMGGGQMRGPMGDQQTTATETEPITEIDVSPTHTDYILLFTAGYLILILSLAIPAWGVLRYQPKTILTGKE